MPVEGVTGLGGALGFAPEATYGTTVAPTKWIEFLPGESLQRTQNFANTQSLRSGRIVAPGFRTVATTRMAAGSLPIEIPTTNLGLWLGLLDGRTSAEIEAAKAGKVYSFKVGSTDPYKKSLTLVIGRPKVAGGEVQSFCYPGTVMNSAEFTIINGGMLNSTFGLEAKDELITGDAETQAIGANTIAAKTESYPSTTAKFEVASAEAKTIREWKVTFNRPTENNRYYIGSTTRQQPFTNGLMTVMVNVTADFEALTLYNFFKKTETPTAKLTFVGGIFETTEKFELTFEFPFVRFEGDSPNIKDMGVLQQTIPMKAEESAAGEAPCTIKLKTSDTAL